MHRRCPFEIGRKSKLKHNMKTALITFREKDIVKLNALQCSDTIAIKILFYPLRSD